jgi:site-specific recombinase XerC
MVGKYSEAFKIKISPHKLRHSVATQLYSKTNSLVQVDNGLKRGRIRFYLVDTAVVFD